MADSLTGCDDLVAVVLAAGAGTRLRPLSALLPKPLCPVGGVALVDLAIDRARSLTPHVAVNVHHGRTRIEAHLAGAIESGSLHLSVEGPVALGTAGALGHLRDWIDGRPVLVVNADSWHRGDVGDFVAGWDRRCTRLLTVVDARRGTWGDRRYAGAALLPWAEVARLPERPSGLWEASWRRLVPGIDLELAHHGGAFFDCGTPGGYLAANLEASGGRSVVDGTAVVEGSVEATVVWPGARVELGEHLRRAVRATDGVTVLVR